ncbi:MAG: hypothetical protein O3A55_02025 [Bacteroidetes bacterium]|nr:hypothetical protein [Bacteroidota bacterium]
MAKVIMIVQYEVNEAKLEKHQLLIEQMKNNFVNNPNVTYSFYKQKGKANSFIEMYVANTEEDFENFENNENYETDLIEKRMVDCIIGKQKYLTFLEN